MNACPGLPPPHNSPVSIQIVCRVIYFFFFCSNASFQDDGAHCLPASVGILLCLLPGAERLTRLTHYLAVLLPSEDSCTKMHIWLEVFVCSFRTCLLCRGISWLVHFFPIGSRLGSRGLCAKTSGGLIILRFILAILLPHNPKIAFASH